MKHENDTVQRLSELYRKFRDDIKRDGEVKHIPAKKYRTTESTGPK